MLPVTCRAWRAHATAARRKGNQWILIHGPLVSTVHQGGEETTSYQILDEQNADTAIEIITAMVSFHHDVGWTKKELIIRWYNR